MSKQVRKQYSPEFKAKVALAALVKKPPWPNWPVATVFIRR